MSNVRHIRKNVFRLSQAEFGAICGVTQATISRWEAGRLAPSLVELARIREAARERRLKWRDEMFFAQPGPSKHEAA